MSLDKRPLDVSDGEEEEELMFAFEEHVASPRGFYSIDGVAFERPAHPMAAILARLDAKKRSRQEDDVEEPETLDAEDLTEQKPVAVSRKRKTFDLPSVPVRVIRPVAKRFKSDAHERSMTAPACLMGRLSLHRTREQQEDIPELENETDKGPTGFRSASIDIPDSFYPIPCPGDAAVGRDRAQSFSSSSSSKSGLFCRRSLDVASPLRVHFNDLELHSSTGSYTGS
ncbi:hypothetical protein PRIC1_000508 [Phytophthora ramorum]